MSGFSVDNVRNDHVAASMLGRVRGDRAGQPGMTFRDAIGEAHDVVDATVVGMTLTDNRDGSVVLTAGDGSGSSIPDVNAPITAALSNPPTQAELEDAIGSTPGAVAGQKYVIADSGTGLEYFVVSTGSAFSFVPLVQTDGDRVTLASSAGIFSDFTPVVGAAAYDPTSNKTFWTYLEADGDVSVRSWDHATQTASSATVLRSALSAGDSHAQPTLLIRSSDRKIVVAYSAHNGANLYVRISSSAADISAFGAEANIDSSVGGSSYTYPVLIELTDGIYLFLRTAKTGATATWSYTKSTDGGATWSAKVDVFDEPGTTGYWMPTKTAADRVDISAVDDSTFGGTGCSVFHMYMLAGGTFYKSDGTEITAAKPFATSVMTTVWAHTGTQGGAPGTFMLASDGYPRILFREFENLSPEDCRYRWGLYNGSAWASYEVASAGSGSLTATAVFASTDPFSFYHTKDDASNVAQIHKATTVDGGLTWIDRTLTDSANEQSLLATVRDGSAELPVLWCSKSGGWTRNDTVAANFFGASFVPTAGAQLQRVVGLDGDSLTDPLTEIVWRIGSDGAVYYSLDLGATWHSAASGEDPATDLVTVDPGTVTYDDSGDDVEVTIASVWGYGADGPYYDSAGVTAGEEALLALDTTDKLLVVIPYSP